MQQRTQGDKLPVAGQLRCDALRCAGNPQGVKQIVPAAFAREQGLQLGNNSFFHGGSFRVQGCPYYISCGRECKQKSACTNRRMERVYFYLAWGWNATLSSGSKGP